jgi:meiotic recombination protein SPO11
MSLIKCSAAAITKIEEMFEQIADDLLNENPEISVSLRTRTRYQANNVAYIPQQRAITVEAALLMKKLSFPGKSADEAWKFCIDKILQMNHINSKR